MPRQQANISPMDRGFLFGDGVYEVIPTHQGKMIGIDAHLQRLATSLQAISLNVDYSNQAWKGIFEQLLAKNGNGDLGLYLQVTRGSYESRQHGFPEQANPTIFAFCFPIAPDAPVDKNTIQPLALSSVLDQRWQYCHIKSTSLLGNVLHYQAGREQGSDESLMYDSDGFVTEASSCNVFAVKDDVIITPPLSNRLLAGITRKILLEALQMEPAVQLEERPLSLEEVRAADEIWLTSSVREVAPVVTLDGQPIGDGKVGDLWFLAQSLFNRQKYQS